MTEIRTYPYLTPDSKYIDVFQDWQYCYESRVVPLNDLVQSWDPSVQLEAEIILKVDLKNILRDCGLGSDAKLRLVGGWRSSGTMLRGSGSRVNLSTANSKQPLSLKVQVSGSDISHDLTLFATLLLISAGSSPQQLSPSIPGSVIWILESRISLDDESQYFPTEITNFHVKDWPIPATAAWYLQWDPDDLYQITLGDVRLYLNASHPIVISNFNDQLSPNMFHQILFFDIARNLILGALSNSEFISDPTQYPEGTIGAVIYNILCEYFPDDTVASLYKKSRNKSLFETLLQHHLAFLRG